MMKVYFTNKSEQDLFDIKKYFFDNDIPVTKSFVDSLEKVFYIISEYPEIGSERYRLKTDKIDFRVWKVKKFPFLVIYTFNKSSVLIYRIVHEKRDLV